ncbi:uncharacterized protein SOCE836_092990 [Sorangium cellulosum]|uniref:Uncharacterized protein n=1 Tax=Sorangium cellulosum TaxID=56 RepID=A0A4P2R292_SORCE|nr:uncharacterized protein SOCE836_092990 [Sorangium cellulosum]WCQ96373.1 hypothetical protein NQZ70_09159 [Sorangium sp. Soce836]
MLVLDRMPVTQGRHRAGLQRGAIYAKVPVSSRAFSFFAYLTTRLPIWGSSIPIRDAVRGERRAFRRALPWKSEAATAYVGASRLSDCILGLALTDGLPDELVSACRVASVVPSCIIQQSLPRHGFTKSPAPVQRARKNAARATLVAHWTPMLPAASAFVEPCLERGSRALREPGAPPLLQHRISTCFRRRRHHEVPPKQPRWRAAGARSRPSGTAHTDATERWEYQRGRSRRRANECAQRWLPREERPPRSAT